MFMLSCGQKSVLFGLPFTSNWLIVSRVANLQFFNFNYWFILVKNFDWQRQSRNHVRQISIGQNCCMPNSDWFTFVQ